jgi:hypothetical protein
MLLVIIDKFGTNLVLVNVNKIKPYKYIESEVQKIRTTNANILGAKWSWTLGGGF